MLLEICANSYESAINASTAGAHRIELCSELAIGGITPSYGLLKKVVADLKIPVHVLIRPRSGDFTYSKNEFEIMKQIFYFVKNWGAQELFQEFYKKIKPLTNRVQKNLLNWLNQ